MSDPSETFPKESNSRSGFMAALAEFERSVRELGHAIDSRRSEDEVERLREHKAGARNALICEYDFASRLDPADVLAVADEIVAIFPTEQSKARARLAAESLLIQLRPPKPFVGTSLKLEQVDE